MLSIQLAQSMFCSIRVLGPRFSIIYYLFSAVFLSFILVNRAFCFKKLSFLLPSSPKTLLTLSKIGVSKTFLRLLVLPISGCLEVYILVLDLEIFMYVAGLLLMSLSSCYDKASLDIDHASLANFSFLFFSNRSG